MARTGLDKLTPISVALTDQMIGLLISVLCVVYVTMHRLAKIHHGPFDRCVDRLPGGPVSPCVTGKGPPQTLRQILFLVLLGCPVSPSMPSKEQGCWLSSQLPNP